MRALLVLLAAVATAASGATLTMNRPDGAVSCTLSKATTVQLNGNIVAYCQGEGPTDPPDPPDPPSTGCQRPAELTAVATAPINQYNGEQNVIRRNQYYALSFTAPPSVAYFSFVEIEQTNKAAARFATISECPGDFVNITSKCYAGGRTFTLFGDTGTYGGCRLQQGKTYWLNVRTATPRISNGKASAEKRSDDTCPAGDRCGYSVSARLQ